MATQTPARDRGSVLRVKVVRMSFPCIEEMVTEEPRRR